MKVSPVFCFFFDPKVIKFVNIKTVYFCYRDNSKFMKKINLAKRK